MNILELVKHQIPNKNGDEETYDCPLCDDEKGRLRINKSKNVWHCFKCGEGGRVKITFTDNLKTTISKVKTQSASVEEILNRYNFIPVLPDSEDLYDQTIYEYFRGRGFTDQQIERYQLSICLDEPYFGRGILLWRSKPNVNFAYFIARRVISSDPRYLNPANPKNFLWTTFYLNNVPKKIVLVEGAVDAIWTSNICPAGALLGSDIADGQIEFLYKLVCKGLREVDILLDRAVKRKTNNQGKMIANETDKALKIYHAIKDVVPKVRIKSLEHAADPGSATLDYLEEVLNVH